MAGLQTERRIVAQFAKSRHHDLLPSVSLNHYLKSWHSGKEA
jgi:hypothetical protein